jgi:hypothetical protein
MLMLNDSIMHGLEPEWIILDFRQAAARVNICSESNRPSREIANAIASAYYDGKCEYENERIVTSPEQLRRFIDLLRADEAQGLCLAEVRVHNSPLPGAVKLVVSADGPQTVAPAIEALDGAFSPLLAELENIDAIKVLFDGKRVSLIFDDGSSDDEPLPSLPDDPTGRPVVMRYTDRLITPRKRDAFELMMEETYGITVVSTEKLFRT